MSKVIQVRGVPDETHAKLVDAAAQAGQSLTAFVAAELERLVERVDPAEHNRRVIAVLRAEVPPANVSKVDVVRLIRQQREERSRELLERANRARPK